MSNQQRTAKGTVLIDVTLREFITRSQLWKYHVANSSLKWVVAKVSYADTLTETSKIKGQKLSLAMGQVESNHSQIVEKNGLTSSFGAKGGDNSLLATGGNVPHSASSNNSAAASGTAGQKRARNSDSDEDSGDDDEAVAQSTANGKASYMMNATERFMAELDGSYVGNNNGGTNAAAANSKKKATTTSAVDYNAPSAANANQQAAPSPFSTNEDLFSTLYGGGTAAASSSGAQHQSTEVDKPVHRAPHVLYMATFHESTSAATLVGLGVGNAYKSNELLNGSVQLKPELFMCLLLRALQLSKALHSLQIVEMVEQLNNPHTVVIKKKDTEGGEVVRHNLNGSKYLRVFGLFLARMLLAHRGEPLLLKRCYEAAKTDFRQVRVMRRKERKAADDAINASDANNFSGRSEDNPVTVMRVDEVAHLLMTSERWDRIAFPSCRAL